MDVMNVLHMNGGDGGTSYASNSLLQLKVISMTKPVLEESITNFLKTFTTLPSKLSIADLGCSSGPNTLIVVSEFIKTTHNLCKEMGLKSPDEYQVFLNDLPGNDFNTIFKSLQGFQENMKKEISGCCFFTGVPGSFYGRLFPKESLHFVHSSYSLQWLSQVPKGLEGNTRNIYMTRTSPESVIKAYYKQFKNDFCTFLKYRSEELVTGGRMILTFLGRRSEDPASKEGCYIWELLARVLNEMVIQGRVEEEKLNYFNIPQYPPSPFEIKLEVLNEGSFSIEQIQVSEVDWNIYDTINGGYNLSKCMRAVAEPLIVNHFGESIVDEIFDRYNEVIVDCIDKEKPKFINVTISLIRIHNLK